MDKKVSVYIPAYNAQSTIVECIEAVLGQSYPIDEIWIIDDGSTDRTKQLASRISFAKVASWPINKGLAATRNIGFYLCRNNFVASVDADCIPAADWLEILMKNFKNDNIAGVSGKTIEFYTKSLADSWRNAHMQQHYGQKRIINPVHLFGSNTIYRRDYIGEVGSFDEGLEYKTNNEDYYISRRLTGRGYNIIYDPCAEVLHYRKDNIFSLFRTYWRWFFLWRIKPNSFKKLLQKNNNNLELAKNFFCIDCQNRRKKQFLYDFLFIFCQLYFDIKYYCKSILKIDE